MRLSKNKKIWASPVVAIILVMVVFLAWPSKTAAPAQKSPNAAPNSITSQTGSPFDKNQYPTDVSSSLWVVVNKGRQLPSNYVPANLIVPNVPLRLSAGTAEMHLRSEASLALEEMFAQAKAQNVQLKLESGYRSYNEQVSVYNGYVASSGMPKADTFSARPGHSEHQTGLAADIEPLDRTCEVEQCFEDTPEGKWLFGNAYKYGFIIRYQKNTQDLTGYEYEPWHVRFLGAALANQIHLSNQTLEQFFSLPVYNSYPANALLLKEK